MITGITPVIFHFSNFSRTLLKINHMVDLRQFKAARHSSHSIVDTFFNKVEETKKLVEAQTNNPVFAS